VSDSFQQRLHRALEIASTELLRARNTGGYWEGDLSSSALATATAVTALVIALKRGAVLPSTVNDPQSTIHSGLRWLAQHQNPDGGWGDTTRSITNISTTALCWAAFGAADADEQFIETVRKAETWLSRASAVPPASCRGSRDSRVDGTAGASDPGETPGALLPDALAQAIIARYGKDRTFSVPILTMCALAGRLGSGRDAWRRVIALPFELAAFPHRFFAALRLPVVSYALPALIAIGQARHVHAPSANPFARLLRYATRERTLRKLAKIQPANGGFLEATPLTSFVTMSLAASGRAQHIVTQRGLEFLAKSQRNDGSWPIDTNLATWCTTLAIDALPPLEGRVPQVPDPPPLEGRVPRVPDPHSSEWDSRSSSLQVLDWLLQQQHTLEHPYTHAAPGGWAWTDLPGGVPDADDTSGALLALHKLRRAAPESRQEEIMRAAEAGLRWLLNLQNRDGGIPTFCRGWGALPFDRSSADITAHAIRAWRTWQAEVDGKFRTCIAAALPRAVAFLQREQRADGSWLPLWFGNQHAPDDENPTYGTSRVLRALVGIAGVEPMLERGVAFLRSIQNDDGSWSAQRNGPASIEETALAVQALTGSPTRAALEAAHAGGQWLVEQMESGAWREPSPIGFYFARLWYFERLYPVTFTVDALRALAVALDRRSERVPRAG
jgi:squalene-hopene/tetraprenyl-beta-curcumene cyclase